MIKKIRMLEKATGYVFAEKDYGWILSRLSHIKYAWKFL